MIKSSLLFCLMLFVLTGSAQTKTVSYSGSFKGYTKDFPFKTGKIILLNEITGITETYLIDVAADGKFAASFPLEKAKECYVWFPYFYRTVYFEPGKRIVHNIDISNINEVQSTFSGDLAKSNNDQIRLWPLITSRSAELHARAIEHMTPDQYKAYYLNLLQKNLASLDSIKKGSGLDEGAYQRAVISLKLGTAEQLIQYNYHIENEYRKNNNISFADKKPVLKERILDESYYDFLKTIRFNDPKNMVSADYFIFIMRLKTLELILDRARIDYSAEIARLEKDSTQAGHRETLQLLRKAQNNKVFNADSVKSLRPGILKRLAGADITLELELIEMQDICQVINDNQTPLSEDGLARVKARLKNKQLFPAVAAFNRQLVEKLEANKTKTGFVNNKTPNVAADSVFNNILKRYKGKTIFIDFWATWCGPCLQGIKETAALKEELKDKDIVFLYITNTSSPEKSYDGMIPGIKGEHYRLSMDEYNVVAARLGIVGIPHYAIADKQGVLVENNYRWRDADQIKMNLQRILRENY